MIGHARNYANVVDTKYGIDGFYALDATWEQYGKFNYGKSEAARSTYKEFLLTTEEGRNNTTSDKKIDISSYDEFFTCQTPEELRTYLEESRYFHRSDGLKQLKILDPDFNKPFAVLIYQKTKMQTLY